MLISVRPWLLVILGLFYGVAGADMPAQPGEGAGGPDRTAEVASGVVAEAMPQPAESDAGRAPDSLARVIMAQANIVGPESSSVRGGGDARSNRAARLSSGPQLPGAVVAVMFGVFGILVVARRSARR